MILHKSLLACILFITAGLCLDLYRDTLYSRTTDHISNGMDTLFYNNSSETIQFDSCRIYQITNVPRWELRAIVAEHINVFEFVFRYNDGNYRYVYPDSPPYAIISPLNYLIIHELCIDYCCECPTSKRVSTTAIGDTIKVLATFYSGNETDSVLIISVQLQDAGSAMTRQRPCSEITDAGTPAPFHVYSLLGKKQKTIIQLKPGIYLTNKTHGDRNPGRLLPTISNY